MKMSVEFRSTFKHCEKENSSQFLQKLLKFFYYITIHLQVFMNVPHSQDFCETYLFPAGSPKYPELTSSTEVCITG